MLPAMLVLLAGAASADEPAGARFAYTEIGESPNRLEVRTLGPVGFDPRTIAGGRSGKDGPFPFFLQPPSWSGDGTHLTFAGIGRKGPEREPIEIFVVGSDGSRPAPRSRHGGRVGPGLLAGRPHDRLRADETAGSAHGHGGRETYRSTAVWLADLATGTRGG